MAGIPHIDHAPTDCVLTPENLTSVFEWCEPSKMRTGYVDGRLETVGLTLSVNGERIPALFGDTIREDCGQFMVIPADKKED
ncbi:hypothetical protein [Streptomyces sp. NPDC007074]|uniref:hypothetical protein n=1 Tax=Streptomyces sp. NPDC007074 TaxID=3156764 RepID=UPI0033DB6D2C